MPFPLQNRAKGQKMAKKCPQMAVKTIKYPSIILQNREVERKKSYISPKKLLKDTGRAQTIWKCFYHLFFFFYNLLKIHII